jgi:TolB-like protein/DNA-binding winged helix-turn-helix (wHTH) protein/Flp pilus assembly protein TadD
VVPSSSATVRVVRFGAFEADLQAGELRKQGLKIKLQDQPFQILAMLLERPGELVTREEIRQRLWPADTFVDFDHGLNNAVNRLREALTDSAETPRFIETLPRRGYRFIATVSGVRRTEAATVGTTKSETSAVGPAQAAPDVAATLRHPRTFHLAALGAIALVGLLFGANVGGLRRRLLDKPTLSPIRSIAVLPLENLSSDQSQDYFADGMTEALITDLAQIGSLRVISHTSSMRYRDSRKALPEIAKELNVDAIVEGSVMRSGNQVRIDAQLIQAPTDRHLWAKSYERDLTNVLALQSELARTIASEVQIQLTPKEQARLGNAHPVNPEAYEAYLKGRFFWNKRNNEAIDKSIEYFNEAIRLDPGYAAAYAGLADAYNVTGCGRPAGLAMAEAGPKAKAAALRAVELDNNSAEAHAALGFEKDCYEGDRSAAENEYRSAIALNPNYATAHLWYSSLLLGWRDQDGLDQIQQALRLDPVSPNINGLLGEYLMETRQFDKAVEQLRKTVELDPHQYNSRMRLGLAYAVLRRYTEAEGELKKAEEISPGSLNRLGVLAYVYGLEGKQTEAERMLPEIKARAIKAGHPSVVSLVYMGLGRKDEAILWLDKAYEQRDPYLDLEDPLLDPLRSDPRFQDLERRVKVAQLVQPK